MNSNLALSPSSQIYLSAIFCILTDHIVSFTEFSSGSTYSLLPGPLVPSIFDKKIKNGKFKSNI